MKRFDDLEEANAWVQKVDALLRSIHDLDSDNQGYGLLDEDRAAIVELLGETPEFLDYDTPKYLETRWTRKKSERLRARPVTGP